MQNTASPVPYPASPSRTGGVVVQRPAAVDGRHVGAQRARVRACIGCRANTGEAHESCQDAAHVLERAAAEEGGGGGQLAHGLTKRCAGGCRDHSVGAAAAAAAAHMQAACPGHPWVGPCGLTLMSTQHQAQPIVPQKRLCRVWSKQHPHVPRPRASCHTRLGAGVAPQHIHCQPLQGRDARGWVGVGGRLGDSSVVPCPHVRLQAYA